MPGTAIGPAWAPETPEEPVETGMNRAVRPWSSAAPFVIVPPMAERPPEHRSFRIELNGEFARAICACGWQSDPSMNAGMAGAMWDRHLESMIEAVGQ